MANESGMYHPSGELQGDTKPMPDKGTKTGLNGDTYGADLSVDATNVIGSVGGVSKSDEIYDNMPEDPQNPLV